jgi:hypothetical protein
MKTKFVLAAFLTFVFVLPFASASGITRSFSKSSLYPGETVSVTLDVAVTGGETYYLIDDIVPSGWVVTNPGSAGSSEDPGHVKWAVIQGAASTSYTYEVMAPQTGGTYTFSGKYMFEGMKAEGSIGGQNTISVQSSAATKFGYETIAAPAVVLAGVVISLVIFKSRYRKHK